MQGLQRLVHCCADAFIRDTVHSGNANVGTCTMAAAAGGNAVVDPSLRVFGVRGLRVADASVIPVIPGAFFFKGCRIYRRVSPLSFGVVWPLQEPLGRSCPHLFWHLV